MAAAGEHGPHLMTQLLLNFNQFFSKKDYEPGVAKLSDFLKRKSGKLKFYPFLNDADWCNCVYNIGQDKQKHL